MTKPGVQKPHCEPWHSTIACCTGCSEPSGWRRSSTVKSALPSSVGRNWMHALTALKSTPPASLRSPTHDRARAAVAFGAAFLGAGAMRVLAQILQHGAGDGRVLDLTDRVAMVEANRLGHVSLLSNVRCPWGRAAAMVRKLSPSINATHSLIRMGDIFAKRYRGGFEHEWAYVRVEFLPRIQDFCGMTVTKNHDMPRRLSKIRAPKSRNHPTM